MNFLIVTGMSGAGKSTALKMLEDVGYFCVDNLPTKLIKKFAELTFDKEGTLNKVALGIDIRSGSDFQEFYTELEELKEKGYTYKILFLDAEDEVLVMRYKETRRMHPLVQSGRIETGIQREREALKILKEKADYTIDTTKLLTRNLKEVLNNIFVNNIKYNSMYITVLSFGFKHGVPKDADLVFDVRFIPNPYYIPELREKTGNDIEVTNYLKGFPECVEFIEKLTDMTKFLIPNYIKEGKTQLVIGIGCTGGKHRSVAIAEALYQTIVGNDYNVRIEHRDIEKDSYIKRK